MKSYPRHEMLDIVIEDGEAKGIIARNLVTGEIERHGATVSWRPSGLPGRLLSSWVPRCGRRCAATPRNLVTGEIERHGAHAVVIATGGYGNVFFLSVEQTVYRVVVVLVVLRCVDTALRRNGVGTAGRILATSRPRSSSWASRPWWSYTI